MVSITEEKNISASAEKDKFADEVLSDEELDNVAGGTTEKTMETLVYSSIRETIAPGSYTVGGK